MMGRLKQALREALAVRRGARRLGCGVADYRRLRARRAPDAMRIETRFGPLTLRPQDTDLRVVEEVLVDGLYDFAATPQWKRLMAVYARQLEAGLTPLIVDAGANVGAFSIWCAERFPQAAIVAVEPSAGSAELARANTARWPQVCVLEAAIGGAPGAVEVRKRGGSWNVKTFRADAGLAIVTVHELFEARPGAAPLIVKIDIEGFEADVFAGDVAWIDATPVVVVEPHDWMLPGAGSSASFQNALMGRGRELLIAGDSLIFVAPEAPPEAPQEATPGGA